MHLFNLSTQNSFTVASIIERLLKMLKKEYPVLNQAFLRSDNAGCYKNGALLLSLPEISVRSGIKVIRYNFSDPQAGKDICDRKTAPMKAHIKRWVNEKNDVLTAEDMKLVIESWRSERMSSCGRGSRHFKGYGQRQQNTGHQFAK